MAETMWTSLVKPAPDKEYVAILSYLPLKSFCALPQFFYYTRRIQTQLKSARGLVGYSLFAPWSPNDSGRFQFGKTKFH